MGEMDEDRTIEVGMLTVAEAVALRDELCTMRTARRRWRIVRDTPLTDRLIRTLEDELGGPGTGAPDPAPTPAPVLAAESKGATP
jgi:hypothetical protein